MDIASLRGCNGLLYARGSITDLCSVSYPNSESLSMLARKELVVTSLMILAVCNSLRAVLHSLHTGSLELDTRDHNEHNCPIRYHPTAHVTEMAVLEIGIRITAASVAYLMLLFRRYTAVPWSQSFRRRHVFGTRED